MQRPTAVMGPLKSNQEKQPLKGHLIIEETVSEGSRVEAWPQGLMIKNDLNMKGILQDYSEEELALS